MVREGRNETVDALRGLAALLVVASHCTVYNLPVVGQTIYGAAMRNGYVGAQIFFVISGFIIPFAMDRAGYTLTAFPRFMLKRMIRLDPPFLASIAFVVLVGYAASLVHGLLPRWSALQIAAHLGYIAGILGYPWLNGVYWSLGIEIQWYLLISLAFPLLVSQSHVGRLGLLMACLALPYFDAARGTYILFHLPVFALGTLGFLLATKRVTLPMFWGMLVPLTAANVALYRQPLVPVCVLATALVIAFVRLPKVRVAAFFGAISYPLYLLHEPITAKVMNLAAHWPVSQSSIAAAISATFACSILAAYILHMAVESPSKRLADRIGYAPGGDRSAPRAWQGAAKPTAIADV